jgi:uncharacterized membrane protein
LVQNRSVEGKASIPIHFFEGASVPEETPFQPVPSVPAAAASPAEPVSAQTGLSDSSAAGLAYVTILPAIIFLVTPPYNQKSLIRFHSWQSIFLFIAAFAIHIVLLFIPVIGWLLSVPFSLLVLIVWILCLIKAFNGVRFKLPVIGDLAEKQAGS